MSTLYQDLVAAGVPTDNHECDLQFPWTAEAQEIYAKHFAVSKATGGKLRVSTFHSQKPEERGQWWAEVPFAYDPWWEGKADRQATSDRKGA